MQYDLLITNGHIITLDPVLGELSGADMVVRNRVITDIGPDLSGRPARPGDRRVRPAGPTRPGRMPTGMSGRGHWVFLHGGPCPEDEDSGEEPPHPSDVRRILEQFRSSDQRGRLRMGLALRGPAFIADSGASVAVTPSIDLLMVLGSRHGRCPWP